MDEERIEEFQEQLDAIEAKLDAIIEHFNIEVGIESEDEAEDED